MQTPKVSIQIVTWQRKDLLLDLVESLEYQSFEKNLYEICICDSYSNDGTEDAINNLINKYFNIKYYNIQTNTLTAKRNHLFLHTKAEIVITLDDDLKVSHNFIKAHFDAHKNTKDTVFCGQVRFPVNWTKSSNYYYYRDSKHLSNSTSHITLDNLPAKNIVVMNMSIKKKEIIQIGFMNEEFIKYGGEDQEFGYRLKENNFTIVYLDDALCYHLESSRIEGYLNKLYISARYGSKKMKEVMPDVEYKSNINLLFPANKNDRLLIRVKKLFLSLILNDLFTLIAKIYIKYTDHIQIFYSYNLYNFVCANAIKKGFKDQLKEDDNTTWI